MHPHSHAYILTISFLFLGKEKQKQIKQQKKVQARSQNNNLQQRPRVAQRLNPLTEPPQQPEMMVEGGDGGNGINLRPGGSWCGFVGPHIPTLTTTIALLHPFVQREGSSFIKLSKDPTWPPRPPQIVQSKLV